MCFVFVLTNLLFVLTWTIVVMSVSLIPKFLPLCTDSFCLPLCPFPGTQRSMALWGNHECFLRAPHTRYKLPYLLHPPAFQWVLPGTTEVGKLLGFNHTLNSGHLILLSAPTNLLIFFPIDRRVTHKCSSYPLTCSFMSAPRLLSPLCVAPELVGWIQSPFLLIFRVCK